MFEVSREEILALMSFKVWDKILGTPTFTKMVKLLKQLGANLISVDCPWVQGKGQLGLLQYPTTFSAREDRPYDKPTQQPPTYPKIYSGTSTANRESMCAETIEDKQNCHTCKHCECICVK